MTSTAHMILALAMLALAVLALAAASVLSRRRASAGIAYSLCTLSMAGIVLMLSSELLGLFWALAGTGMLLVHLAAGARDRREAAVPQQPPGLGRLGPLLGGLLLWISLLAVLAVGHVPGEQSLLPLAARQTAPSAAALLLLAHGHYAPALLGVSLILMAACVGGLALRRER